MKYLVGEKQPDDVVKGFDKTKKIDNLDTLSSLYMVKNTYTEKEIYLLVIDDKENKTQSLKDLVFTYNPDDIATPYLEDGFPFVSIKIKSLKDKTTKNKILSKIRPSMLRGNCALYLKSASLFILWNKNIIEGNYSEERAYEDNIEIDTDFDNYINELFSFGR